MARSGDEQAIRELLARQGLHPGELELGRLVRFDPRRRVAICATALIGSNETVVGFGAIDLDGDPPAEPDTLVVDERLTDGLGELLLAALTGRARAIARLRAA
jgi:N-acetylglutamate synthase-like GNAT family acetyltransferase